MTLEQYRTRMFNYTEVYNYRTRLLEDYFNGHGGNFDNAIREYRNTHVRYPLARRIEIIEALYWQHAFGIGAIDCPNCGEYTINSYQIPVPVDEHDLVWYCRSCMKADALREGRASDD